ncbi:DUF4304 domain-containing protein [Flavobacterium sp. LHD-80]|uniref:DUF4304 domain-containing protein n=1 Tax=Flavobacterium sp. LHD-80 TaxID=3071411 RepID=UPI0027E0816D|nr:DUF4304 domain-containing protein [Flavobacterium sp. LHD-80]MDQ6472322.1 DUF4304 domain-containing protein [Flavobacterium sp. LHD-80]
MNAKEKQSEFVKIYLKPTLKNFGYQTSGNTWWKNKGDFFIIINLQNSQWNSKEKLSFCFNIGIALTEFIKDPNKKRATHFDILTYTREGIYLSENRRKGKYREDGWLGYLITEKTDLNDFISELKIDFENEILNTLEKLKTLKDCVAFYGEMEFWGDILKEQIKKIEHKNIL